MARGFDSNCLPEKVRRMLPKEAKRDLGDAALSMPELQEKANIRLERELHDQVANYLRLEGVRCAIHSRMDKRTTQRKGIPDFLLCWKGKPLALELKRPGGAITDAQALVLGDLRNDGWTTAVIRSIPELIELLKGIENKC